MYFNKIMWLIPDGKKQQIQKVIDTLKLVGRSEKTIDNYIYAIHRFLKYFQYEDVSKFTESKIIEYIGRYYFRAVISMK